MKKWQKERNYRRVYDENGQVIANIITVDGVDVEVTEEVFLAYSQMDRRERYLEEQAWQSGMREVSLEYLKEQEKLLELSIKTGRDSLRFSRERLAVIRRLISHMEGQPDGTGCPTDREGSEVTES